MRSPITPFLAIGRFTTDRRGVAAMEFALVLPVMIVLLFFGYAVCEGVSAYRKVTLTAHTVADLATQYQTMSGTDMSNVLNASAQVMVPFPTSNLTIVLTEFASTSNCTQGTPTTATVTWSKALNPTPTKQALSAGATISLPSCICPKGASVVFSDVTYAFNPPVTTPWIGAINMHASLYMSPRQVSSVAYTGS